MALWNEETEDQMISMIQERPALYDVTEKGYSNRILKTQLWREIENQLDVSEKELRKKWDSLRTQYARYKKIPRSGSFGAQQTGRQKWILTRLHFLDPHTKTKDRSEVKHNRNMLDESPSDDSTNFMCPIDESLEELGSEEDHSNMPVWKEDTEEQLVSMIQERPALYDITEKSYGNRVVKIKLWREIEDNLVIPGIELRKKWDNLRTQFARYKKLAHSRGNEGQQTSRQKWIMTRLQFLEPHIKRKERPQERPQDTPLERAQERPQEKRIRMLDESPSKESDLMRSIGETLGRLASQGDQNDAIAAYCKNIEHRMRQLPPHLLPHFQHEVDNCLFRYMVGSESGTNL